MESRDVLNYTLATSVAVITFLFAWILWYLISMVRRMERTVRQVSQLVERGNDLIDFIKDKISGVATVLPIVMKGVEKVIDYVHERSTAKSAKKNKQQNTQRTAPNDD